MRALDTCGIVIDFVADGIEGSIIQLDGYGRQFGRVSARNLRRLERYNEVEDLREKLDEMKHVRQIKALEDKIAAEKAKINVKPSSKTVKPESKAVGEMSVSELAEALEAFAKAKKAKKA